MNDERVLDLSDCTEFRQTLTAKPPPMLHATLVLLLTLIGGALIWSYVSRVDIVVKAPGLIRPLHAPDSGHDGLGGHRVASPVGGRVMEITIREGDTVKREDLLIRLDTESLDNEINGLSQRILSGEQAMAQLRRLQDRLPKLLHATKANVEAELIQVEAETARAREMRAAEIRLAELEKRHAVEKEKRLREYVDRGAVGQLEIDLAVKEREEAEIVLARAELPLAAGQVEVLRTELGRIEEQHARDREELQIRIAAKRGEVSSARASLANLKLRQKQALLRAHTDGVITSCVLTIGDLVQPGQSVASIAQDSGLRMDVFVSSIDVGRLRVGMPARVKLDAFDYRKYGTLDGRVDFISPDSRFLPTGALGYLVRVALDRQDSLQEDRLARLRIGMTGLVEVVTEEERLLTLLFRKMQRKMSPWSTDPASTNLDNTLLTAAPGSL